jgi:hypothetical protein
MGAEERQKVCLFGCFMNISVRLNSAAEFNATGG